MQPEDIVDERFRCLTLRKYLQGDQAAKGTAEMLNNEVKPEAVTMKGGLLVIEDSFGERLIIPTAENTRVLKNQILQENHDATYGGHPGRDRLLHAVSRMAYWPRLRQDVERYVSQCVVCQKVKAGNQPPTGLFEPLGTPKGRWTEVTMDYAGPLPVTKTVVSSW